MTTDKITKTKLEDMWFMYFYRLPEKQQLQVKALLNGEIQELDVKLVNKIWTLINNYK